MLLEWTLAASSDLDSIQEYIGRANPGAAIETVLEIVRHVGMLAEHPGLGRPGRVEGTRELVIAGLPYLVAYLHSGDSVKVVRVLHRRSLSARGKIALYKDPHLDALTIQGEGRRAPAIF